MAHLVPAAGRNADGVVIPLVDAAHLQLLQDVFRAIQDRIRLLLPDGVSNVLSVEILNLLDYICSGGKRIRLQMTIAAFQHFDPNSSSQDLFLACVLGWVNEIVHGLACMVDDVVDGATRRRGRTCWHLLPEVGRNFCLHSHSMIQVCDLLIQSFFSEKPYYTKLLQIYNEMKWVTLMGEKMDSEITARLPVEKFSNALYRTICNFKTSHYTFYFPIAAALTMRPEYKLDYNVVKRVAYDLGYFFQVQDDFLDVFGDPHVTGKVGSDIQERKCTWLIVKAVENADSAQILLLKENYGSSEDSKVIVVKQVFEEVGMRVHFEEMKTAIEQEFNCLLAQMPPTAPIQLFRRVFNVLANRQT